MGRRGDSHFVKGSRRKTNYVSVKSAATSHVILVAASATQLGRSGGGAVSKQRRNTDGKRVLIHAQFDAPIEENGPSGPT